MTFPRLPDWVYPTLEPPEPSELQRTEKLKEERLATIRTHNEPKSLAEAYAKLHQGEMERLKSVEARLGEILRLAPITASLLLGGMFALLNGGLGDSGSGVRYIAAAALLYLDLQLACSTIAAVRGMGRAKWEHPDVDDLVAPADLGPIEFQRKLATQRCQALLTAERNINLKVSQMAVAHCAIRNFAAASALFAALGLAAVGLQHPGAAATKAIRSNPEIQKLLKGPQGPPGPPGPKGEPGRSAPCAQPAETGLGGAHPRLGARETSRLP